MSTCHFSRELGREVSALSLHSFTMRLTMASVLQEVFLSGHPPVSQFQRRRMNRKASGGFALAHGSAMNVNRRSRLSAQHKRLVFVCSVLLASTATNSRTPASAGAFSTTCCGTPGSRMPSSCCGVARIWSYRNHMYAPSDRIAGRVPHLHPCGHSASPSPDEQYSLSKPRRSTVALTSSASGTAESSSDGDGGENSVNARRRRPDWAPDWAPTPLVTMRPIIQLAFGLVLYIFHLNVLTQHQLVFPVQLIPNDRGWFQSIGLDS